MSQLTPEMASLKQRQKATWMAGNFDRFASFLMPGAEAFVARLSLGPEVRVLDVGCGTGNATIPAAQTGAKVVGIDIATNLLEQGRRRAGEEGLEIRFEEGDAEDLPYEDASFDVVISLFGAMFAPRPERVAAELIRVCRSDGKIVMANWPPTGFISELFKTTASYVPAPPGVSSPLLWGDGTSVRERLQSGISDLQLTRRLFPFSYPFPVPDVVEFWRQFYGPTHRAFEALDVEKQNALRRGLEQIWSRHNIAADGATHVDAEYVEIVAKRNPV